MEQEMLDWLYRCCRDGEAQQIRLDAGLTRSQVFTALRRRLGGRLSHQTLESWENGITRPTAMRALAYAQFLEALIEGAWTWDTRNPGRYPWRPVPLPNAWRPLPRRCRTSPLRDRHDPRDWRDCGEYWESPNGYRYRPDSLQVRRIRRLLEVAS